MLTVSEVAERLRVSEATVYGWCSTGLLPQYRVGARSRRGRIRIDPGELAAFVEGMRVEGRREAAPTATRGDGFTDYYRQVMDEVARKRRR